MPSADATEFTSTVLNVQIESREERVLNSRAPGRPGDWILHGEAYFSCVLSYARRWTVRG